MLKIIRKKKYLFGGLFLLVFVPTIIYFQSDPPTQLPSSSSSLHFLQNVQARTNHQASGQVTRFRFISESPLGVTEQPRVAPQPIEQQLMQHAIQQQQQRWTEHVQNHDNRIQNHDAQIQNDNSHNNNLTRNLFHPVNRTQKVLCLAFIGQLGNQLFQYASVLGLAYKFNRIPVVKSKNPDRAYLMQALQFPPPEPSEELRDRCKKAKYKGERACCYFFEPFAHLDPAEDMRIGVFLQSWKYFPGMESEVKKAFTFKEVFRQKAQRSIEELRKKCNPTIVGVHIRRGAYVRPQQMRRGYVAAPPEYFLKAMKYMRQRFGNVTFVVSVDDSEWFLTSVTLSSDVIILTRQEPEVDMVLLSSLDHVIISVGTFSWWVGFLNEGVTVYWKDFIVHGSNIGRMFEPDGATYVHPVWVPL